MTHERKKRLRWPLLGAAAAALIFTTAALAGSGVGGVFNLGETNSVNATSALGGSTAGSELKVTNGTGVGLYGQTGSAGAVGIEGANTAGGPGLQAWVTGNSVAPLKVNSTHVVPNLHAANSDALGGQAPGYYLPASVIRRIGPTSVSSCNPAPQTCNPSPLITLGQLTFSGLCTANPNPMGGQELTLYLTSSAAHSAVADTNTIPQNFRVADMGAGAAYQLADLTTGMLGVKLFVAVNGDALSADGHEIFFNLYMGQNARATTDNSCVFGGSFVVV
jgi:hypothetical protein